MGKLKDTNLREIMNQIHHDHYILLLQDPIFKSKEAVRLAQSLTDMLRSPSFSIQTLSSSKILPRLEILLDKSKTSIIELVSEQHDLIKQSPTSRIELETRDHQTGESLYNLFIKAPVAN